MAQIAPQPVLPAIFRPPPNSNIPPLQLITQGAEALVYRTTFLTPNTACALKYRPSKAYRHPTLDARLTRSRILAEARVLIRCRKEGVRVPAVLGMDWEAGWIALEWIDGQTIRACLDQFLQSLDDEAAAPETKSELWDLMARVGQAVGKMHEVGIVHGDLTTSNLMLRGPAKAVEVGGLGFDSGKSLDGEVVLIDFGLAIISTQDEDKAVDLYVLERAFGSTHPQAEGLFKDVLRAYGESYKQGKQILKKLEGVRQRGRKKSMLG